MTATTAIERLRELLDERGVEWVASGTDTCWTSVDGYPMRAWDTTNGTHMRVTDLTPEQAITATLGGGRFTAEQVHELIAPHLHARPTFDFGQLGAVWRADFQAIADALNDALGNDRAAELEAENAKLRKLVRTMFYSVHPLDREQFLANVTELGIEVDG